MTTNSPTPVDGDVQACKPKRIDHSKLAAEIVHNLVSTDSCDEEVTEKLILWVLNRLNKEFPTPPAQLLRPVELPNLLQPGADGYDDWYMHSSEDGEYMKADDVIAALEAAGVPYEVKA